MKKKFRIGLLPQVLVAIVLGILLGGILPSWGIRIFVTFNEIFSQLLSFLVPLIILGMVAPAIADMGKKAGKMLLLTVGLAYGATIIAGLASYGTAVATFPFIVDASQASQMLAEDNNLTGFFQFSPLYLQIPYQRIPLLAFPRRHLQK